MHIRARLKASTLTVMRLSLTPSLEKAEAESKKQRGGEGLSVLVWCRPDVDGKIRRGWKRRRDFASPQQLDGISNIHNWNARNAGQSDLSEKEGGEDRQVRNQANKKKGER